MNDYNNMKGPTGGATGTGTLQRSTLARRGKIAQTEAKSAAAERLKMQKRGELFHSFCKWFCL
jgi:hypothetical protein